MTVRKVYCHGAYGGTACGLIPWSAGFIHQDRLKHDVEWTNPDFFEETEKEALDEGKLDL